MTHSAPYLGSLRYLASNAPTATDSSTICLASSGDTPWSFANSAAYCSRSEAAVGGTGAGDATAAPEPTDSAIVMPIAHPMSCNLR